MLHHNVAHKSRSNGICIAQASLTFVEFVVLGCCINMVHGVIGAYTGVGNQVFYNWQVSNSFLCKGVVGKWI